MKKAEGRRSDGHSIVRELFSGPFYQQGRGYYVSLEFFAIARGILDLQVNGQTPIECAEPVLLIPPEPGMASPVSYRRHGLIVARKLMHGDPPPGESADYIADCDTRNALQTLLEGLELRPPGRLKPPGRWQQRHFYPYPSELIHYDAVETQLGSKSKRHRFQVERYTYRGAGGFVYGVLCRDRDQARRIRMARRLQQLLGPSNTALGCIARALADLDSKDLERSNDRNDSARHRSRRPRPVEGDFLDESDVETQRLAREFNDSTCPGIWEELLCEGVDRILSRDIPGFRKVDAMMNWLPLACAFHQHSRANEYLGEGAMAPLVFDAGVSPGPVREQAKRDLRNAILAIKNSLEKLAGEKYTKLVTGPTSWKNDPRSFYTGTLNASGAINSLKGDRFFSLTSKLLETVVLALVDGETSLESFCTDVLFGKLRWVVDAQSGDLAGLRRIESASYERNAHQLSRKLSALGLLREYSDATRMIGVVD